jgi:predicted HTH transcriptional regulator
MHDLFEQLAQQGEAGIKRLISQRVQENVELEFKGKANPGNGELTKDDRRNLGIALSALSNSMGGLLIWGVVAAKNEDKIDCASDPQPIFQIEKFKNEIERAISQAISPKHDGIRVLLIESSEAAGSGYLAIHVERSERRPHRCEFGEKQYFKRIGDSSIAMEHYDIEDSFKRIVVPSLQVQVHPSNGGRRSGPEGGVRHGAGFVNTTKQVTS